MDKTPLLATRNVIKRFGGVTALSGAIANGRAILAAQAMGADLAYVGSLFIASDEANAADGYKQMIVGGQASDIVYSSLFTGVHGNYLRPSIAAAGLDPDALPEGDASRMSFGSGGTTKAWRDIWGCGQGLGSVDGVAPAGAQIARLTREYVLAKGSLDAAFVEPPADASPCVIAGGRIRSHAELRARAARAAAGFQALGAKEGDTVALCLRNDFALFEATLAAGMAGVYPVPINWHATADEAGYVLRDCGAKALVVHEDLLPGIQSGLPDGLAVIVVPTPAEIRSAYRLPAAAAARDGALAWDGWISRHVPIGTVAAAERAAVIYTSGTTGRPKGVKRVSSVSGPLMQIASLGYGLTGSDRMVVLMNGPMYHSAPNSYAMMSLGRGAEIVLQPRFEAEEMLALIERHRVTHMHLVPTMFVRLLRLPEAVRVRYDVSSLRFVVHGAAPCLPEVKQAMIAWWGPVIHEYYGSTETALITTCCSADALRKPGTVGRALPGVTVKVLGDGGVERAPGELGDVFIQSVATSGFSYIGREGAETVDGFVTVGDIGYLDAEGFLFLCDRRRDMIISGGVNIYPAEIEAVLLAIPGVRDGAVFGIPDPEFGEQVCAHVEVEPGGPDAPAIRAALAARLSRFKVPQTVELVGGLPREDSGKIFKRKLREPYWAGAGRSI